MAKRPRKNDDDSPGVLQRMGEILLAIRARLSLGQWLTLATLVACVIGIRFTLGQMEKTVQALPAANPEPRIKIENVPEWMIREGWVQRLVPLAKLEPSDTWNDSKLLENIANRFSCSGWVREVQWARKSSDGTIVIACDFRRPIGMVQSKEGFIAVDADCYRLPELYSKMTPGWIAITGVRSSPPPVGKPWNSKDLRAGVRLVSLFFDKTLGSQISTIDVSNYGGQELGKHRIVMHTQKGMTIRWGSAPGEEIYEPTAAEKITNIEYLLRVDPTREWIDVSVFGNKVVAPRTASTATDVRVVKNPRERQ